MRTLLLLLSLWMGTFGSLMLSGQALPPQFGARHSETAETLEERGLYPVFSYQGRPHFVSDLIRQKERWEGILSWEEVKFLPSWEKYRYRRIDRILLAADGDDTVYIAKSNPDGFEAVAYIKKKGLMKRTLGKVWKGLKFGMDGPLHIILSIYGI
jgi:hypothetical protein